MPDVIFILLLVVILILMIGCFYIASNMNKKMNRMRRRYDMLLRGHTDINLEEYVLGLNGELDAFKEQRQKTEQKLYHVEQWMARTDTDQSAYVEERFAGFSRQLTEEMRASMANVNSEMKRLDEQVFARMDQVERETSDSISREISDIRAQVGDFSQSMTRRVKKNEEDAFIRFDALEKDILQKDAAYTDNMNRIESMSDEHLRSAENSLNEKIAGLQTMTQNRFQTIEQRTQDTLADQFDQTTTSIRQLEAQTGESIQQLAQQTTERLDGMENQMQQRMKVMKEETSEKLKSESLKIREQLSMAFQKSYLYRYNAFEDVTGESSFSLVLLDEYRNGFILTSIYSRANTTTFAKEIRSGEPVQKLSPEEMKALAEAMKR